MRHATPSDLEGAEDLLDALGRIPWLVEKRPGVFYRRHRAFCHFHADDSGLYVDARLSEDFERLRVQTRAERARFMRRVRDLGT